MTRCSDAFGLISDQFRASQQVSTTSSRVPSCVLDGADWHTTLRLRVLVKVTLVRLPPNVPELNPVERVWLHLRERHLNHRLLDDYDAIVQALWHARRQLTAERLRPRTAYDYLKEVRTCARRYHQHQ